MCQRNQKIHNRSHETAEKQGKLTGEAFSDYGFLFQPITGGEAAVYKVYEKRLPSKKRTYKALRRIRFWLVNKPQVIRELEVLSQLHHESVVSLEKVFFEFNSNTGEMWANLMMPWMHTLKSWLMKSNEDPKKEIKISKCKRSLSEIRNIFRSILLGLQEIHSHDIVHSDLKFENIFVNEKISNDFFEQKIDSDPKVAYWAEIGDFGCALDLKKLSCRADGTPGFQFFFVIFSFWIHFLCFFRLFCSRI